MTNVTLQQLLEAGSHFGHQARRWSPAMKRYIYAQRDGVHIFDLVKTKDGLDKACEFLRETVAGGGKVLLLGTKRQAADLIKEVGQRTGMPFVNVRWMGGLFTNFDQVGRSIRKLADLKGQKERGELKKYTKREQLLIDREIGKLEKFFGGVSMMDKLPTAIFVVDTHREEVAVREANRMGVPVVGMVDTNGDPDMVDYVIPVNDDAVKSIELVIAAVEEALSGKRTEDKTQAEKKAEAEVEEKPKTKRTAKTKNEEPDAGSDCSLL